MKSGFPTIKIDYTPTWQQLQILTRHWISDTEFYQLTLKFLDRLITKYFVKLADDDNKAEV